MVFRSISTTVKETTTVKNREVYDDHRNFITAPPSKWYGHSRPALDKQRMKTIPESVRRVENSKRRKNWLHQMRPGTQDDGNSWKQSMRIARSRGQRYSNVRTVGQIGRASCRERG